MAKKRYPSAKKLKDLFLEVGKKYPTFNLISSERILKFSLDDSEFYIYFKCISPEGNPHPIEHQRAQLPRREEFNIIKQSEIPFLFVGYDCVNDVYVCWNPVQLKERLNVKSYVSFYSRLSAQQSVKEGIILVKQLSNGDKYILFKRNDVMTFIGNIEKYFPNIYLNSNEISLQKVKNNKEVKDYVCDMQDTLSDYDIVQNCINKFQCRNCKLSLAEWYKVVMYFKNNGRKI